MITKIHIVSFILIACIGCTQQSKKTEAVNTSTAETSTENRLLHYWDEAFIDSAAFDDSDSTRQALVDFISELAAVPQTVRDKAIYRMLSNASTDAERFEVFFNQLERYLYDPNSPVRNDSYYQTVLEYTLDSVQMNASEKTRRQIRLDLVRKNQIGETALDFSFESTERQVGSLYDVKAPYLLLFFYEPGCSHCEDAIDKLSRSPRFNDLIDNNKLEVLAVYPFGDETLWREYQSEIPESWINVIDKDSQIILNNLYDLKATPTIYLLNQDKEVLLKDSDLANVVLYLGTNRI